MKCPDCNAECSERAVQCEFCGHPLSASSDASHVPPPVPDSLASDNPYAASDASIYGAPRIPAYEVPNHLALSVTSAILSFLCCCIPFGIVPVIFSTQVNSRLLNGDFEGAKSASSHAKLWAWICIGVALAVFAINVVLQVALGFNKLD